MSQTDERLKAIRERAEQATPGPWEYDQFNEYVYNPERGIADIGDDDMTDRDGFFIAHAREDIPFLLDLVDEQTKLMAATAEAMELLVQGVVDDDVDTIDAGLRILEPHIKALR